MSNLTVAAGDVAVVEMNQGQTSPTGEASMTRGQYARVDNSTGKIVLGNNSSDAEIGDINGVLISTPAYEGAGATIMQDGVLDVGDALDGMSIGDDVWLSTTDGVFDTADQGRNEIQTATITGTPTGGTFTLTYNGATTAAIAYNAAASAVESALRALSTIDDCNVSGSAGGPYSVEFTGNLAKQDLAAMTADGSSLTGGSSPGVTIATSQAGRASKKIGQVISAFGNVSQTVQRLLRVKTN